MTHRLEKPASSAAPATSARRGRIEAGLPGQSKRTIWSPRFTTGPPERDRLASRAAQLVNGQPLPPGRVEAENRAMRNFEGRTLYAGGFEFAHGLAQILDPIDQDRRLIVQVLRQ